jgi:sortase A
MGETDATPEPRTSELDRRRRRLDRAHARRRRHLRRLATVLSVAAIAAGLAIGAHVAWFYLRLHHQGGALVTQEKKLIHQAAQHPTRSCPGPTNSASTPQGLLDAPSIGMEAPVLSGTGDAQLDVAVGHLSSSVWPGQPGASLMAAHDVSYFSRINDLARGSTVLFSTPCRTYVYKVFGSQVVHTGSPVYSDPSKSQIVLETCYPLNALFIAPQRYLVWADLSAVVSSGRPLAPPTPPPPPPQVPAPAELAQQGLGLSNNDVQLGGLELQGQPDPLWQQSPAPIADERAVIESYDAAVRSAEQQQPDWWQALASGVAFSASDPLHGGTISEYTEALNPTLQVQGDQFVGALVHAGVKIEGGPSPGPYTIDVNWNVSNGMLVISNWRLVHGY